MHFAVFTYYEFVVIDAIAIGRRSVVEFCQPRHHLFLEADVGAVQIEGVELDAGEVAEVVYRLCNLRHALDGGAVWPLLRDGIVHGVVAIGERCGACGGGVGDVQNASE